MDTEIKKRVIQIIKQAGIISRKLLKNDIRYKSKSLANFVTEVDLRVQLFLRKKLQELIPNSLIISEELQHHFSHFEPYTWLIDPIDGTTNMLHKYPHFAISVSLLEEENPILAIIYNPITRETFFSEKNKGSTLNNNKIQVSSNSELNECIIGFGFPYDRSKTESLLDNVNRIFLKSQDLRRSGSSSLDIAYIACGRIDGYFEFDLLPWDYTAGSLILKEAGGKITDWNGNELDCKSKTNIIASNSFIHQALIDGISE